MWQTGYGDLESRARMLMDTNFIGRQQFLRIALRELVRYHGKCVIVSSDSVRLRSPGLALYRASHAAMEAYATQVGMEYIAKGVAVNVVSPSWVAGDMTADLKPELVQKIKRRMPLGRMLWNEEVAEVIVRVLEMPHVLTGIVIPVTGGFA